MTPNAQHLLTVSGYSTALMHTNNHNELQTLLEKCVDYSLLVSGALHKPTAAASLLTDCPPGKSLMDKFVLGFSDEKQVLVGVLDAMRDYPNPADWWLGLLLLDPSQRNHQLGRRIVQAFEHWVGEQGARRIFLGVLEENQKAYRFWHKLGFELVEKRPAVQFGERSHVVVTMLRNLIEE